MINKKKPRSKSKISQKENEAKEMKSTGKISKGENVYELKKAGEEVRFNELLLNSFFDSPGHMRGIVEIVNDTDIRHIKDNLVTASYLNLTPADLQGKLSSELGEPKERIKIWIEHYKTSQNTGLPVSWEYFDIEGLNKSWLSPTVAYIGKGSEGNPRFTYDIINITDRKKAEEALHAAEELSRQRLLEIEDLYRNAPVGLCTLDSNLRFLRINERLAEINGIPAADHIGKTVRELLPTLADAVEPGMRRIIETGKPQLNMEIVSETPAQPGIKRTWQEQWLPIKDADGRVNGLSIVVEEITMLKKAEKEVIDAQQMTQSLINHTPAIVYALDLQERFLLANTTLAELLDSTPEAMIGKRRHEFMPKDDADWHESNDRKVFKEGRPIEFEEYSQLKDRSITWLTTKFPLVDSQGRIYAIGGISNDISDRRQAQVKTEKLLAEIQTEKERLAALIYNIPDEVWIADLNKNFILMNSISCQQFGLDKDIIGIEEFSSGVEVLRPDYSPRPLEEAPALLALKGDIVKNQEEIIRIPATGELQHRQVNASPIKDASGNITGSITIVRDITERKRAEEELIKLGFILSESQKIAHLGSFEYIVETQTTVWSEEEFRIYGLDPTGPSPQYDEMIAKCIHPDDAELLNSTFSTAIRNGSVYELEHRIVRPDGSIRFVYDKAYPYFDSNGKLVRYVGATLDITERNQAEDELKEAQKKLELALNTGNIGIWDWNLVTDEVFWDKRMKKMLKVDDAQNFKTYEDFEALINEEDVSHVRSAIERALDKDNQLETIYRLKSSGEVTIYINAKAQVFRDDKGKPIRMLGVCIDITELKRSTEKVLFKLNEELLRSNKELESFAYVASHDLQEPLRMVTSFTQLLAQQYNDKLDDKARQYIDFAVDGSKRMYELLNGLLTYSRINTKGKEFTKVDLTHALESASKNLSLIITEKKVIIKSETLPVINGDSSQMSQLFQNLISNSIKFNLKTPMIYISSKSNNDHYLISVKDNGTGVEPQYFEKIFQIFQRLHTREQYEGTGIGLSICRRIIERHGGKIWVESEPGNGSTFFFTIPKNTK